MAANLHVQQNQPAGVPPLSLTGERTLPDVPVENYWYRRHLAVYEWIAARVSGQTVIDMACGEGYGAAVLARRAREVIGVEANPEACEHARLRYTGVNLRFERALAESFGKPGSADAVCLLQTIEHVREPSSVLAHLRTLLRAGGTVYVSTPNLLTLAPAGAASSGNPWHLREYRAHELRVLCESAFGSVELYGVFHAGRLRLHELLLALGWERVHRTLRLTSAFYDRFTPAISSSDFELRLERPLYRALDFVAICR